MSLVLHAAHHMLVGVMSCRHHQKQTQQLVHVATQDLQTCLGGMHHTHQLVMPFLLMQNPYAQRLSIASKMSMSCFPLGIQIAFIGLVYTYIWHAVYAFSWSCALQLSVLTPVDVPSMCSALDILWVLTVATAAIIGIHYLI